MKNMKLLIDTNVLIDMFYQREPFFKDARNVFRLCEVGLAEGSISALSFADMVYVMRKQLDPDRVAGLLRELQLIFYVEDLKARDLKKAVDLGFSDYEDALQSVCAERIHADYIVTRNLKDFENSPIPAISPGELIHLISMQ